MLARLTGRSKSKKEKGSGAAAESRAAADRAAGKTRSRPRRRCLKLTSAEKASVPALLEPFKYQARSATEWASVEHDLQITIQVRDHVETKSHTLYQVQCTLSSAADATSPTLTWACQRRLQHLRKGLHDVAKEQMGSFYSGCFKGAPFAHRGGLTGTTKRLDAWCARLARCINSGAAPPLVVAQALKLLDAPQFAPGLGAAAGASECLGVRMSKDTGLEGADTTDAELGEEDADSDCESYESDWESDSEADDLASIVEDPPASGMEDSACSEGDGLDSASDLDVADLTADQEDSLDQFMRMAAQGHCWRK